MFATGLVDISSAQGPGKLS